MNDLYLIAEIANVYDTHGNLVLKSYSDFPDRFVKLKKVLIDIYGSFRYFTVESCRISDNSIIVKFKNFDSDSDASYLIGKRIYIEEKDLVELPENFYFIHDLIGSSVFKENRFIGKLTDVLSLPSNDIYVVEGDDGGELLIPALKRYIVYFDQKEKKLFISNEFEYDDEN